MIVLFLILVTPTLQMLFKNPYQGAGSLVEPNSIYDHFVFNWKFFKVYHQVYSIYFDMLFHFLLGFYLHRAGFLQKIKESKSFRKKFLITTLIICAIMGPVMYTWIEGTGWRTIQELKNPLQKFLLRTALVTCYKVWVASCVFLYISILISLSTLNSLKRWFKPLAAFGQIALSNYLIQSFILVPYALAFDKFNNMPPFRGFILFLIVFAFQLVFSEWWLRKYKLGPFEWLLRSFTYWKWQPLKRKDTSQTVKIAA
jgi:uncharacterized protein